MPPARPVLPCTGWSRWTVGTGVVFDRLAGPSLLAERGAASTLAHLHAELHDLPPPALPQLTDTLASWGIDGMEPGRSLFHGDLHPGNVLRHRDRGR